MQLQVVVIGGPDTGRTFKLEDGQTLMVGRGQASDTQINDPRMSRIHCHIQVDGGQATLVDASSVGGTVVNGQPIKRHELALGDVIEMGDITLNHNVITPDGKTAKVLEIYPQGVLPVFKIELENGKSTRCCEEHLWEVKIGENWKLLQFR